MTLPSHCAECGVLLMGGATVHEKDCPLYPISYQGLIEFNESKAEGRTLRESSLTQSVRYYEPLCHCGQPLHYTDKDVKFLVQLSIDRKGEYIDVTDSTGRTWRVQRHYIALHGIKEKELSTLGFEEVTDAGTR